ncbi:Monoacylglycerol lipase ABHD12 [Anabarilius grahami]|uniref:Monoacylglycerol lipase ABHD12 n=1 Tax=Anabarilius grahami TaxID=495550 RepID=A0A3N0XXE6_ANAGA|nr:Monoacylglycerol lipase ABHD12 [Anabarilius grahami]
MPAAIGFETDSEQGVMRKRNAKEDNDSSFTGTLLDGSDLKQCHKKTDAASDPGGTAMGRRYRRTCSADQSERKVRYGVNMVQRNNEYCQDILPIGNLEEFSASLLVGCNSKMLLR